MNVPAEYSELEDGELLRALNRRDEAALAALTDRHAGPAYALALRILRSSPEAEAVVHDTLLQLWLDPGVYDPTRGELRHWLLQATYQTAMSRRHNLRAEAGSPPADSEYHPRLSTDGKTIPDPRQLSLRSDGVHAAFARLPEAQRYALELAYFDGLTQTEIAARTGELLPVVREHLRSGLLELKKSVQGAIPSD